MIYWCKIYLYVRNVQNYTGNCILNSDYYMRISNKIMSY